MNKKILMGIGIIGLISVAIFFFLEFRESEKTWQLTESNSWIEDTPTVEDFVPLGIVHTKTEDHILKNLPDPKWGLQCFIFVGEGKNSVAY